jgi:hypothetical protein
MNNFTVYFKKAGLFTLGGLSLFNIAKSQGDVTGKVITSLGDLPHNVGQFTGTISGNGNSYQLDVLDNGEFTVLGIPSAVEDKNANQMGKVFEDGPNNVINASVYLQPGLDIKK